MTYSDKLKDPRWQRRRLEVMGRDEFRCQNCSATDQQLSVHHWWYEKGQEPWEASDRQLATLCDECHVEMETARCDLNRIVGKWEVQGLAVVEAVRCICEGLDMFDALRVLSFLAEPENVDVVLALAKNQQRVVLKVLNRDTNETPERAKC